MSKNSYVVSEINVPRTKDVMQRTYGFFREIGWTARPDSKEPNSVYVHPLVRGAGPVITYWHSKNPAKIERFVWHDDEDPSRYSRGLWHPMIQELTELVLIVPDEDAVEDIFEGGGSVLEAHTHTPLRQHAGALEFRFTDPFNNALRVTADPGYEI